MKYAITFHLLFLSCLTFAQITGRVTGENGEPLPYATVYIRNTSNGTVTNVEGDYRLSTGKGPQEVVFQYIGYKQRVEKITVGDKPVRLDARLESTNLELEEMVVSSIDPAVRIMREVIAKRRYYKKKVSNYACDVYIKGFYKMVDTPKKLLGQDVGNLGGMLDSTGAGVVYLSESVSKVWSQDPPGRKKEVMVSSRVSGSENGFSLNRATLTEFSLYDERLEIEREILSPLADNAFNYYSFKHAGRFKNELGFTVEKIKVIPKRPADPTFSGFLYVVDDLWLLAGADLSLTGPSIKQPVLDTMRIQQQFVPLGGKDTWGLLTQVTSFRFSIFGFKIAGFFNSIFSNYDLNPKFEAGLFNKEIFKIEDKANEQTVAYWNETRPIPLTEEEGKDYVKKDSLQKIWKSKAFLDSMDRKGNRFRFNNLLFGYTWDNSFERKSVAYPASFRWIQFNTVQGWLLDVRPVWKKESDQRGTKRWLAEGDLNYGFSEKKLRASARIERRFESIRYRTISLEGGTTAAQFNRLNPIGPLVNTIYSLLDKQNFLKLYDKSFARAEWSQILITGLSLRTSAEWARRTPLVNHSDYSWKKGSAREYTSNDPAPMIAVGEPAAFPSPDILAFEAQVVYRPKQQYSSYPKFRVYTGTNFPEFILNYRKAMPLGGSNWADFDLLRLQIQQSDLSWGLAGHTNWNVGGGFFLRHKSLSFMDLHHASGNQRIFGNPVSYLRSFFQLPYYAYSTDQAYAEIHAQHHLEGWLLDKIPLLRKLNWKEVFGANFYYADQASRDPAFTGKLPYWEINWGFENIGIKAIRPLRIDVVVSFFGKNYSNTGVILGLDL
ncbi:MAG: DUF5686 and carboxypeptidase regulatory-like domain-containing protein [Saprospiraceae bacterium]|nr:DUF5686 and carboxypeptidase regulatory-like domain-containing protein [Saprospiraceae bacterium]